MRKIFVASLIPVMLFLVFSMFALPADAQIKGPKDSCEIGRDIDIDIDIDIPSIPGTVIVTIESKTAAGPNTVVSSIQSDIKGEISTKSGGVITKNVVISSSGQAVIVNKWGSICLINAINNVIDWIFLFLIIISVVFIAIAGFLWMTSGSDASRQKTAGAMVVAALIGIVIAMLARILPGVVLSILG